MKPVILSFSVPKVLLLCSAAGQSGLISYEADFVMRDLLIVLAAASGVVAHTIFQEVLVNGVSQGHLAGVRVPSYDGSVASSETLFLTLKISDLLLHRPINDVTSPNIICNGGPNPLNRPFSKKVIDVKAGDTLTMVWHHTLDGDKPRDKSDPVDPGHVGPTLAYMAKVDDARTEKVTGLRCKSQ
jgi:cellulase